MTTLSQLAQQWRDQQAASHTDARRSAYRTCADELEAWIAANPAAQDTRPSLQDWRMSLRFAIDFMRAHGWHDEAELLVPHAYPGQSLPANTKEADDYKQKLAESLRSSPTLPASTQTEEAP